MAAEDSHAVAMVYAEALFDLAGEQGDPKTLLWDLNYLAETVRLHPDFALFLASPVISRQCKAGSLVRVFEGQVSSLTSDFLKVLVAKDRLNLLDEIQICYEQLEDRRAGRVRGVITTAIELSDQEQIRLTEQIGRALRKNVSLQPRVDPLIIGGMIVSLEDKVIDSSVKGILKQANEKLSQAGASRLGQTRELIVE